MGISHRPLVGLRFPQIIIVLLFTTDRSYFVRTTLQPSSHSCPIETRDDERKFGRIIASFAAVESSFASGATPIPLVGRSVLSGCQTDGPVVLVICDRTEVSSG